MGLGTEPVVIGGLAMVIGLSVAAPAHGRLAHALHTTLTEIRHDRATGTVELSVRAFRDDLDSAVAKAGRNSTGPASDSALARYVATRLTLGEPNQPTALTSCGVRRTDDLVWLCFRGKAPRGLTGAQVGARMMADVFDDQVNIVQIINGSERRTLIFTKRDGPKRVP